MLLICSGDILTIFQAPWRTRGSKIMVWLLVCEIREERLSCKKRIWKRSGAKSGKHPTHAEASYFCLLCPFCLKTPDIYIYVHPHTFPLFPCLQISIQCRRPLVWLQLRWTSWDFECPTGCLTGSLTGSPGLKSQYPACLIKPSHVFS